MQDCIHGRLSPGGDWASLIILDFIFQSQKRKIRIKSARIELSFEEESGQRDKDPEVFAIAPDGAHKFVCCPIPSSFLVVSNSASNPRDKLRSEAGGLAWMLAQVYQLV